MFLLWVVVLVLLQVLALRPGGRPSAIQVARGT